MSSLAKIRAEIRAYVAVGRDRSCLTLGWRGTARASPTGCSLGQSLGGSRRSDPGERPSLIIGIDDEADGRLDQRSADGLLVDRTGHEPTTGTPRPVVSRSRIPLALGSGAAVVRKPPPPARIAGSRRVVEVLHRRLDVGVAHPLLHPADVRLARSFAYRTCAANRESEASAGRRLSAGNGCAAHSRRVAAEFADEDEVVIAGEAFALAEPGERLATSGAIGTDRTFRTSAWSAALPRARPHADRGAGEVDVAPAQREQLAAAQARERCGQVDRAGLARAAARTRAQTSSGEKTSMSPLARTR